MADKRAKKHTRVPKPISYTISLKDTKKKEKSPQFFDPDCNILHPKLGVIPTKFVYEKTRVHCFYDYDLGVWIPMSLELEMLHSTTSRMIDSVQKYITKTVDRRDILMMLRTWNYSKTKCVHAINKLIKDKEDSWHIYPVTAKENFKQEEKKSTNDALLRETTQFFVPDQEKLHPLQTFSVADKDDIVFEIFRHQSGKRFDCIIKDGHRYYFDDKTKNWSKFPKEWYSQGMLYTTNVLRETDIDIETGNTMDDVKNVRGFIWHPFRGRLHTDLQQKEGQVINCYYDNSTEHWLPLPVGWEVKQALISRQIAYIRSKLSKDLDSIPDHEILSMLRTCNYQQHDTISLIKHIELLNNASMIIQKMGSL